MKTYTKKEIATYYNHTILDYKVGWQLNKSKGVHFGLWYDDTKNLHEAIINSNKKIAQHIPQGKNIRVLDAGCGVGGTAIYLAENYDCYVEGITLSEKQCNIGKNFVKEAKLENNVNLTIQDYTKTDFDDESFDMIFAIESLCHATEKSDVYKEAYRLLKPGGKLVFLEYIKTDLGKLDENRKTLEWLLHRWAIADLDALEETHKKLNNEGFTNIVDENLTNNVLKSVKIMRRNAMMGLITIPLYTILHPTKYIFSRRHPESGWALHKCFRKKLIDYYFVAAEKPI
ncbi:MAG: hypothetical protein C0598_13580 [Marinilabiliales bacterium]|nr:MAG: hypothetical protein C0598_13580 [Marinilabiliales bacterium]